MSRLKTGMVKKLMRKNAFSLIELMIVISILGIMAAIVIPTFQSHIQKTREVAAKDTLRILRTAIETYTAQHNGVPPGYMFGNPASTPNYLWFMYQMVYYKTNSQGLLDSGSDNYPYGPYLQALPVNPFNDKTEISVLADGASMPETAPGTHGWVYHPATKSIKLDWPGNDSTGVPHWSY